MSESFDHILNPGAYARPACRVAYTLNNEQPVLCSIISDQPFFYLDIEESEEDAADARMLEELDNLRALETEIKNLQKEIQTLQRLAVDHAREPDARLNEIAATKIEITARKENAPHRLPVESIIKALNNSRLAQAYVQCARQYEISIEWNAQIAGASYERKSSKILINPALTSAEQIVLLARELRRHWQHRHGALIHPLTFHPDHAVLINRLQAADLAAAMVRIAWELQLAGDKDAWNYIENSPMAELGRAFAREAYLDFRTLNNGLAAAALVETWFLSERCRTQDKILIRQMLADYRGYVFNAETAAQMVTPALIAALGTQPYGNNYLARHARTIMEDPVFTEIRDRSNANFLWFIKFEQSYKETEEALLADRRTGDKGSQGLQTSFNTSTNKPFQSDFGPETPASRHVTSRKAAKTAEIICFASAARENGPQHKPVDKSGKKRDHSAGRRVGKGRIRKRPSAQIVHFSPGSAD